MSYTVKTTPEDKSGSGWYEILPAADPPVVLTEDVTADWVVIGAGFTGLTAAKRLSDHLPNEKVVVLDAQKIAWGSSGRNSGFMIDLPHDLQSEDYAGEDSEDLRQIRMNRYGIDIAKSIIQEYGLEYYASDKGKINAATDHKGLQALKSYSTHLNSLGETFTQYSKAELQSILGTDYYEGGIHTPGCLMIQPAGYIRGLAAGLKGSVEIYENSPVLRIETGSQHKVMTSNGTVTAKNVILTVNGHLESFGLYQQRLMHIFLYGSMTRQLSRDEQTRLGGHDEWGITPAHPLGSSIRRIKEGRIVVRNQITYNPKMKTSEKLVQQCGRKHDESFRNRFPMLEGVEMEYRWGGHLCLSLNSVPVFGEIERGIYAACCQNGLGACKGTLSGALVADMAMGVSNPMIDEMLAYPEPKKIYPEPFMSVGVKSYLKWSQCRAGKDI